MARVLDSTAFAVWFRLGRPMLEATASMLGFFTDSATDHKGA